MPVSRRVYPIRPLGRRGYYGAQNQSPYAGAFKAGSSFASELVGGIGKAMAARKAQQQQDALNAQANRMMNTSNPALGTVAPRAGLVSSGVNVGGQAAEPGTPGAIPNVIRAGVPQAGTAPFSTGVPGVQLQQSMIKSMLDNQRLAQEVRNQGIAASMAARRGGGGDGGGGSGGNANRWKQYLGGDQGAGNQGKSGGKTAKEPAYTPYQYDAQTDPRADAFPHIAADFDAKYGKGAYADAASNLASARPETDDKGNETGNVVIGPADKPIMTLPAAEASYWQNRYNAANVGAGHPTIGKLPPGINPNSGQDAGTQVSPVAPKDNLELRALPFGTWITDPKTGKTIQKQPLAPPAQQTSAAGDLSGQGTAGLASALPAGLAAPDQGTDFTGGQAPTGSQVPPDQGAFPQSQLGAEIRRMQMAGQLQRPQPPVDMSALADSNTPSPFFPGTAPPTGGGLPPEVDLSAEIQRQQMASQLQGVA